MGDFQKDVIARSYQVPVVVDFWAPWCGPCRVLGPVIEELAAENIGQWDLVKINTEENEDLASTYQIRSIPNVKLFYRGEVIHEFMGALPKNQIREWLNKALPPAGVIALDQLLTQSNQPDVDEVEKLQMMHPESAEIRIVLSQMVLWDEPARVINLLQPVKMGTSMYDKATWLRDIATFLLLETDNQELLRIQQELRTSDLETAIQSMIDVLGINNSIEGGILAKAAIGIFNTLGTSHPLSKGYRKKLDMVLWV